MEVLSELGQLSKRLLDKFSRGRLNSLVKKVSVVSILGIT